MLRQKFEATATCPNCGAEIKVRNPKIGQRVTCPECDEIFVVVTIEPLELDWADLGFEEEEV